MRSVSSHILRVALVISVLLAPVMAQRPTASRAPTVFQKVKLVVNTGEKSTEIDVALRLEDDRPDRDRFRCPPPR